MPEAVLVRLEPSADPRDVGAAYVRNLAMVGYRGEVNRMPFPRDIINGCASAGSLAVAANVVTARAGESFSKGPITGLKLLIAALDVARENSQANSCKSFKNTTSEFLFLSWNFKIC